MRYLQAVNDKVVVKIIKEEPKKTESGLVVPFNDPPQGLGQVLTIGNDVSDQIKNEVKVGDIVVFGKHMGMDIIIDNKIYKVLFDKEIYGVMRETEE